MVIDARARTGITSSSSTALPAKTACSRARSHLKPIHWRALPRRPHPGPIPPSGGFRERPCWAEGRSHAPSSTGAIWQRCQIRPRAERRLAHAANAAVRTKTNIGAGPARSERLGSLQTAQQELTAWSPPTVARPSASPAALANTTVARRPRPSSPCRRPHGIALMQDPPTSSARRVPAGNQTSLTAGPVFRQPRCPRSALVSAALVEIDRTEQPQTASPATGTLGYRPPRTRHSRLQVLDRPSRAEQWRRIALPLMVPRSAALRRWLRRCDRVGFNAQSGKRGRRPRPARHRSSPPSRPPPRAGRVRLELRRDAAASVSRGRSRRLVASRCHDRLPAACRLADAHAVRPRRRRGAGRTHPAGDAAAALGQTIERR